MRRLQRFEVKNLCGFLNQEILLHTEERMTLIVGPNGSGKTLLLRLLFALFRLDIALLAALPWGTIRLEFDDGAFLDVSHGVPSSEGDLEKRASQDQGLRFHHVVGRSRSRREYTAHCVVGSANGVDNDVLPPWLRSLCACLPVVLFEMQTVLLPDRLQDSLAAGASPESPLIGCARDVAHAISGAMGGATRLSLSSETAMIDALSQDPAQRRQVTEEAFQEVLAEAGRVWDLFASVGLVQGGVPWSERLLDQQHVDETARYLLACSLDAFLKRSSALRELAVRADLLTRVLGRYLYQKRLRIDSEQGFSLSTLEGEALPVTALSDGEQRLLLLLSRLLFQTQPATLVLIDEPETSLHIDWQSRVLDDLQQLARQVQFDVVLATHSPSLIAHHWDLVSELAVG
jgi:ABC-type lipoprotein export system ATPase subunit